MEKTGKGAIGRITFRSRERPVLVHYYRQAVVATTLRYPEEVFLCAKERSIMHRQRRR